VTAKPVESRSDRATFDVTVATDAPAGLCGIRVATRNGLSNAHLFQIEDLPVRPAGATLEPPVAIWGHFREAEVDRFPLNVKAGQRLSFEVIANRFGKDADALVTIRDPHGKIVAQRDNDPGLMFDCRFEHEFREAGMHIVEVREARYRGSEHFQYVLRVGAFPAIPPMAAGNAGIGRAPDEKRAQASALAALPATTLAFNVSPLRANPFAPLDMFLLTGKTQATLARVPGELHGVLARPGDKHAFAFELAKGQSIHVRAEAKWLGSPADLEVVLTDRVGREQRRGTDANDEINLEFTAPAAGLYGLTVRDQLHDGGQAFAYRVTVRDAPFPPRLVAEVEGLNIPQGSYQPIPILVTRTGPATPIRLKLVGAPPGLRLTPTEIGEKDTAIVCRLEADATAPLGLATIQILSETTTANGHGDNIPVRTKPLIDRQLINVDLIPIALREDQKRLPASLAERFAVQVTPPAPFEIELPEQSVTLARYQHAEFPIKTTRRAGFTDPIAFAAKGGQLADKAEGRTRVYAEFTPTTGSIHSRILANIGKTRVEVSATGMHEGRRTTLIRTFELNLTTAFAIASEPAKVTLMPGTATRVRVTATRVKTFDGAMTVRLAPVNGLVFPETVTIPKGQDGVDVDVKAAPDINPGRYNVQHHTMATVCGFEEEVRGQLLEAEVPPPAKKK
jgi:hypothetical protein